MGTGELRVSHLGGGAPESQHKAVRPARDEMLSGSIRQLIEAAARYEAARDARRLVERQRRAA